MRFKKIIAGLVAWTALTVAHSSPRNEELLPMTEAQRRTVLATLLSESGETCPAVSKTFYQGDDKKGNAFWNASCSGQSVFVIQLNDTKGSINIMTCEVLKAIKGQACFSKFK